MAKPALGYPFWDMERFGDLGLEFCMEHQILHNYKFEMDYSLEAAEAYFFDAANNENFQAWEDSNVNPPMIAVYRHAQVHWDAPSVEVDDFVLELLASRRRKMTVEEDVGAWKMMKRYAKLKLLIVEQWVEDQAKFAALWLLLKLGRFLVESQNAVVFAVHVFFWIHFQHPNDWMMKWRTRIYVAPFDVQEFEIGVDYCVNDHPDHIFHDRVVSHNLVSIDDLGIVDSVDETYLLIHLGLRYLIQRFQNLGSRVLQLLIVPYKYSMNESIPLVDWVVEQVTMGVVERYQ